jgi:hypothetical protein
MMSSSWGKKAASKALRRFQAPRAKRSRTLVCWKMGEAKKAGLASSTWRVGESTARAMSEPRKRSAKASLAMDGLESGEDAESETLSVPEPEAVLQ